MAKRGRLSRDEERYILANQDRPPAEIAGKLGRTEEVVKAFLRKTTLPGATLQVSLAPGEADRIVIREELRSSERWKRLKQELTDEEIKLFEQEYVHIMGQFKADVLKTEEIQIFDVIKFEILKSRNMIERRKARDDIARLENMQRDFLSRFGNDPSRMDNNEKALALSMETQLQAARASEQSRTTEYVKLQERQDVLMKTLKATRDQRVKQIENSKVTFLGVIKMLQERDHQAHAGRQMELMKLAGQNEYERLGRPVKYDDGTTDNPILSADTVDLDPEEEDGD